MNNSEREKLGQFVAQMIYSFETNPQQVSTGRQMLDSFPSIAKDVENYRYPIATNNVVSCIQSAAYRLSDPAHVRGVSYDVENARQLTFASIDGIFDDYLDNFDGDEFYSHLYELEEQLANADSRLAVSIISELFKSDYWRDAVSNMYEIGTPEFNYLTNTK